MEYKTPEIGRLMEYLGEMHPRIKEGLKLLEEEAASIYLDFAAEGRESVEHVLLLATGEMVYLRWDVEYLVNYSLHQPERLRMGDPYELANFVNTGNHCIVHRRNAGCVVASYNGIGEAEVKKNVSYVIVAELPCISTKCIMDGGCGFYDAMIEGRRVRYFSVVGEECMMFLQPDSRRFVELCKKIEKLVASVRMAG